jgi:hypothetical protein
LTRRRHGGAEMPTRFDNSTLVMRPSSCNSLKIFQSMESRSALRGIKVTPVTQGARICRLCEIKLSEDARVAKFGRFPERDFRKQGSKRSGMAQLSGDEQFVALHEG